ncbi:hypothetical protein [Sinanaerobacter sp. ZZT-01]|uniref:hypothetical protein n=1 Tax=Sinanaerobacter sp. ZZT-01 TaxID=3111540 RepID=UPI002D76D111|nr:hypothetical protein [Sinanaerobacter sp. ZZT-01]WRR92591.1 hypothetical protein U5921_11115 [Sinanaerobacter sp. ZZT-01]
MSKLKWTVIDIPKEDVSGIYHMFEKQSKVDLENLPEKYAALVHKTRETAFIHFEIKGVYASKKLVEYRESEVVLEGGIQILSKMMPILFEKSTEVVFYAVTVLGYLEEEKKEKSFMEQFFLDAWATAFAETGASWLKKHISEELAEFGWYATSAWSPGQHNFSLENQKPLFQVLEPEKIGLTLSDTLMMHPHKSVSGVFGIGEEKDNRRIIPCDYCDLRQDCPSAYQSESI